MNKIRFVIIDFEFGMYNKFDLVLISGAIGGSRDLELILHLEGTPLILGNNTTKLLDNQVEPLKDRMKWIFRKKKEKLTPLFAELRISTKLGINNRILDLNGEDLNKNGFFTLTIKDNLGNLLFGIDLGYFKKNGHLLKLEEAHRIICDKKHGLPHIPEVDVAMTRCLFNFAIVNLGEKFLIPNLT
ncbi:uncharacterized protein LOC126909531 [Daktulosphaira vitifoliae]|uniref:uncharacterized protein LOC126909531 n=1 Tax=Daktulosphaira vitifoliae TaxID=58002 RepID=UPI0021AA3E7E|nr:uncharacterized protein LOC126909531 [Daktulosphaira vitifoliae]